MKEILTYGTEYLVNGYVGFVIYCLILVCVGFVIKKSASRFINHKIEKIGRAQSTTYSFAKNTVNGIVNIATVFLCLMEIKAFHRLGTTMLGASGILAVVIGLAAQDAMSNFIGGFLLSFYKPFKVGDLISISEKNLVGTVEDIGLRHTVIKTYNNSKIVVPNSIMNSAIIENKSNDSSKFCNFVYFNISYQSNIDKAIEIIQMIALKHPDCLDGRLKKEKDKGHPIVPVYVTALKDFSVELRAAITSKDAATGFILCNEIRKDVKKAFDENGVVIPYPTHIIHREE